MQTPYPDQVHPTTLFTRERRRQRMLQFLAAFESRSWPCAADFSFLLPVSKTDLHPEPLAVVGSNSEEEHQA